MSHPSDSEARRKELLLKVPKDFKTLATWPNVSEATIKPKDLPRYKRLTKAADYFLKKQSVAEIAEAAGMKPFRVLDYIERALEPWTEGVGITGTRSFVRFRVQSKRIRSAPLPEGDPEDGLMGGFGGAFGLLFTDKPIIETTLVDWLNGQARPNKVNPKTLHTKFLSVCRQEGQLKETQYPLNRLTKGFEPLMTWFHTKYLPVHLLAHIRRNGGKAAAVAAGYSLGDGESRTPVCDYLVWVIDECDSNLNTKIEIPSTHWGGETVRVRRFPVLRLRSVGDYAMNIAYTICFTRQAKGPDIIKLLRNAVLGQPVPPMVDPNMRPVEGAGFPQNIFETLRHVVPAVIYLDNALSHLFNDLQEVATRLFGGLVVLGTPGTPQGRPEIESGIHNTRCRFELQLPGTLGSGPNDPQRENAERPTEQLVHVNHYEQGLYCVLANENVSDTASAGYLDAFTRLKDLLARGTFEPNYLPEHRRAPYNFCAPKRVPVKSEITRSGRLPFVYIGRVDRRYSSAWLKLNPPDGVKEYWVLQDYENLCTAVLLDDNMAYVDTLRCEGQWGRVPFDDRILQIYKSRKIAARFKAQPRDLPLFQVLQFLADGAKADWSTAQDFAYVMTYLKRMVSPEELAAAQLEFGNDATPLIYNDGYQVPSTVKALPAAAPVTIPSMPVPPAPSAAPRLPGRRFSVPRGMR